MAKHGFDNLNEFFNKVKTIGFIERLFFWSNVVTLSHDAYAEFKNMDQQMQGVNDDLQKTQAKIEHIEKDKEHLKEVKINLESEKKILEQKKDGLVNENKKLEKKLTEFEETQKANIELKSEKKSLEQSKKELIDDVKQLEKKVSSFESMEKKKQKDHEEKITEVISAKDTLDEERNRIRQEKEDEDEEARERMKKIWKEHEDNVQEKVKTICSRHNIEYVDKVSFKGSPDNTINICKEFIIFDAKSPRSDDLSNFKNYIKNQAESAKKYAKIKNVKKEIFLVIPTNTVDVVDQTYFNLVDYAVHVITLDALEPIILALRKIEDYEFAENLSPEDREHICRIIGKLVHSSKRRIQVDHFFATEVLSILNKCYDLPKDILDGAVEAEKSGLLNPPMERRAKLISTDDITKDLRRTQSHKILIQRQT